MYPVGEQNDEHLPIRVDPQRGAREAGVAEGALRHVLPAAGPAVAGIPAQGAMAGRPLGEERNRRVGHNAHAVVDAAIQQHLGKHRQVFGGAEQPRVAGHPAKGVGILIMDLAPQRVAARRGDFGRSRPYRRHRVGTEMGVRHAELGEHAPLEERVERLAAGRFRHEAQQVGPEVGILVATAGRALDRRGQHGRTRGGRGLRDTPEFTASRETGTVREQMTHRHLIAPPAGKVREVPRHGGVEIHLARIEQHHDGCGGRHDLGERRQIVKALPRRHASTPAPIEGAESARQHRVALPPNHDRGTRIPSRIDPALHHAIDGG